MPPTKKQRQVFEALLFLIQKGERPTVREIGALVGLRSPATVMKHLQALEREGLVSMSGKSRGIHPLQVAGDDPSSDEAFGEARPEPRAAGEPGQGIPVVGRIAAGSPIEAIPLEEGIEAGSDAAGPETAAGAAPEGSLRFAEISIDPQLFAGSGDLMALRVAGDSMIEAGILDGDFVIIRRQPSVEEGEIAAVEVDGGVTLKRWSCAEPDGSPASVRLVPANERFRPIEITASDRKDVRVLGKYVGLVRGDIRLS